MSVESNTPSTRKFPCPKTKRIETTIVKKGFLSHQNNSLRSQKTIPATYPVITHCTGLESCGIKKTTRGVVTYSRKDCPFNTSLKL